MIAWTPDTGTRELPSVHRGAPLADLPTTEVAWWIGVPSVPTRYVRRSRLARFRRSPLVRHLRRATAATFWPAAIGCGVIVGLLVIAHLQGVPVSSGSIR